MSDELFDGGCDCRAVRYRMHSRPMFVHCCHCRWCQRESGAAFALNAMIEADRVELLAGPVDIVDTPSASSTSPCTSTRSASIIALIANADPVSRWHHVQWQQLTKSGRLVIR